MSCSYQTENQRRRGGCLSALRSRLVLLLGAVKLYKHIKGEKASVVFDPGHTGGGDKEGTEGWKSAEADAAFTPVWVK